MRNSIRHRLVAGAALALGLAIAAGAAVDAQEIPRTASGRPDLSGTYDTATLTPLERPSEFGDRLTLTEEEAAAIAQGEPVALAAVFGIPPDRNIESAPPSEAPPVGGDGSTGAAGAVGGYNTFWMDRGTWGVPDRRAVGETSHHYRSGERPAAAALTAEAQARTAELAGFFRPNSGTAWWLIENGRDAPGPYDDPEIRPPRRALPARVRVDLRPADAAGALQQPEAHRADRRPRHDSGRDGARRPRRCG